MYKLIDFILLIILIGGMIHNYSSLFAGYRRKKELPYIVIVYLIEAPYRGFMAKNMPYSFMQKPEFSALRMALT